MFNQLMFDKLLILLNIPVFGLVLDTCSGTWTFVGIVLMQRVIKYYDPPANNKRFFRVIFCWGLSDVNAWLLARNAILGVEPTR